MSMPKAAVDEEACMESGKDKIGCAGQFPLMESKPEPTRMQTSTEHQLKAGILSPNAAHIELPLLRRENIYHTAKWDAAG